MAGGWGWRAVWPVGGGGGRYGRRVGVEGGMAGGWGWRAVWPEGGGGGRYGRWVGVEGGMAGGWGWRAVYHAIRSRRVESTMAAVGSGHYRGGRAGERSLMLTRQRRAKQIMWIARSACRNE